MTRDQTPFRKRGRLTILSEMLALCLTGPVKKTHLMYQANLSHGQLHKFLTVLLDKGFCTEARRTNATEYRITAKGRRFVNAFRRIQALFDA
jgi:predicted transcriptional regulator